MPGQRLARRHQNLKMEWRERATRSGRKERRGRAAVEKRGEQREIKLGKKNPGADIPEGKDQQGSDCGQYAGAERGRVKSKAGMMGPIRCLTGIRSKIAEDTLQSALTFLRDWG